MHRANELAPTDYSHASDNIIVHCTWVLVGENAYKCFRCKATRVTEDPSKLPLRECSKPPLQPCVHRGDVLRTEGCASCGGNVHVKVYACTVFEECTFGKAFGGIAVCSDCTKYQSIDS